MNKADLVDKIAGACEMSKAQATTAIDTTVDSITSALRKGDRVALIGFGTFSVSQRKARNGRNPQTGVYFQTVAVTNTSRTEIMTPLSLALVNLPAGIRALNANGFTSCSKPLNTPFVDSGLCAGGFLPP